MTEPTAHDLIGSTFEWTGKVLEIDEETNRAVVELPNGQRIEMTLDYLGERSTFRLSQKAKVLEIDEGTNTAVVEMPSGMRTEMPLDEVQKLVDEQQQD